MPTFYKNPHTEQTSANTGGTDVLVATGVATPGTEIERVRIKPTDSTIETNFAIKVSYDGGTTKTIIDHIKVPLTPTPTKTQPAPTWMWVPQGGVLPLKDASAKLYFTLADNTNAIGLVAEGKDMA